MGVMISETSDRRIAIFTLDRPSALNALDGTMLDQLDAALSALEADRDKRAVVIAGQGRAFCAGADLKEIAIDPIERVARMHELVLRLVRFPKISVAAIDGFALGGGLELAMACTFRVASSKAIMGLPEIQMDLIPGYGGTQLLPRIVGVARALEIILGGEPIGAERALEIGLVSGLAASGKGCVEFAVEHAARYARHDPYAQGAARAAVWNGQGLPLGEALKIEYNLVSSVARRRSAAKADKPDRTR
jgi:enoyl-CoA hydratase/carnithine racemase